MLALLAMTALAAGPATLPAAPCRAESLALRTDGENGNFNGMSHGGTRLILRNTGSSDCLLPGLPTVIFLDADGKALATERKAPAGMHPGPVVVPVRLAPGAEASTPLRWVSGEVYDSSRCVTPTRIRVRFGARAVVEGVISGRICAPGDVPAAVEQPPMSANR